MKLLRVPLILIAGLAAGCISHSVPQSVQKPADPPSPATGFTHQEASPKNTAIAENKPASPAARRPEPHSAKSALDPKFRSFAKKLPSNSGEEVTAFEKSLAPGDRAAALEAILSQVDLWGIDIRTRELIDSILKTWAYEDFDGAWAWCQQIESDGCRMHVGYQLLFRLAKLDPKRALALHLEMTAVDSDFRSDAPVDYLEKVATKDAATYLALLWKVPYGSKGGISCRAVPFATDFDFQQAADGTAAFLKKRNTDYLPVKAINFLSSWAERDVDAAYAWLSKNPRVFDHEDFCTLLDGIEKKGGPGASSAWAAVKFNMPGTGRDAMIRSLANSRSDRKDIYIKAIAQAMPDAASSDHFLGDIMMTGYPTNGAVIDLGYALTQMSSPEVRLETLQRLGKDDRLKPSKIPDAQLQQWGLTRQQVEQAARH